MLVEEEEGLVEEDDSFILELEFVVEKEVEKEEEVFVSFNVEILVEGDFMVLVGFFK